MKKILIRAGMSPYDNFNPAYIIDHKVIGNNIGNAMYVHGIYRALTTEDAVLVPTYSVKFTDDEIEAINAEYDAFIIPLANAFKGYFMNKLHGLTSMVKRLKIPCVVIGVGTDVLYGQSVDEPLPFEEDIRDFFRAVLEKSALIGIRGEYTGKVLARLGFHEGTEYQVIGCPSMYTLGGYCP